jgi:hypothetical protein
MIKFFKKYKSDIFLILGIVVLVTLIIYNVTRLSLKRETISLQEEIQNKYLVEKKRADSTIVVLTFKNDSLARVKSEINTVYEERVIRDNTAQFIKLNSEYEILKSDSNIVKYDFFDLYVFMSNILNKK